MSNLLELLYIYRDLYTYEIPIWLEMDSIYIIKLYQIFDSEGIFFYKDYKNIYFLMEYAPLGQLMLWN